MQKYSLHDGPGIRTTVFLKGCPLKCLWCHNPEGISPQREIVVTESHCIHCGECLDACPNFPGSDGGSGLPARHESCNFCGACVDACPSGARRMLGDLLTVGDVMACVLKDRVFYDQSGGGVTFSGGEPLSQPQFLLALLEASRSAGLHTVLDTTGFGATGHLLAAANIANLVLYDLKAFDEAHHRRLTGISNKLILDNLRCLDQTRRNIRIRVPVVPGFNDDLDDLRQLAGFVAGLQHAYPVDLLPFHRTGIDKFARLGILHCLDDAQPPTSELMATAVRVLQDAGLRAATGGRIH